MFKLIVVIYFFSGSGGVDLESITIRDDYKTKQLCEDAAKQVLKDLYAPRTSFEVGAVFKDTLVRHTCA